MADPTHSSKNSSVSRKLELAAIIGFVILNVAAPFVVGEMYPVTISPMFCDQPNQYCTYQIFDQQGNELDPEQLGLHLVYDGNPVGLGMGIEAKPTMHGFGEVPTMEQVENHIRAAAAKLNSAQFNPVKVVQTVVCCEDGCPVRCQFESTIELLETAP